MNEILNKLSNIREELSNSLISIKYSDIDTINELGLVNYRLADEFYKLYPLQWKIKYIGEDLNVHYYIRDCIRYLPTTSYSYAVPVEHNNTILKILIKFGDILPSLVRKPRREYVQEYIKILDEENACSKIDLTLHFGKNIDTKIVYPFRNIEYNIKRIQYDIRKPLVIEIISTIKEKDTKDKIKSVINLIDLEGLYGSFIYGDSSPSLINLLLIEDMIPEIQSLYNSIDNHIKSAIKTRKQTQKKINKVMANFNLLDILNQ